MSLDKDLVFADNPIDKVQEHIARLETDIALFEAVLSVLAKFDGKKITKAIETAVKKALPGYITYYGKPYSWYQLNIWGNGIPYNRKMSINLGYTHTQDTVVNVAVVRSHHLYYGDGAKATIVKLKAELPTLRNKIERVKQAQVALEAATNDLGEALYYVKKDGS